VIVNLLGLLVIALIVWTFFLARPAAPVSATGEDVQRIDVRVKGGYTPETIVARPDRPLEIAFSREEDSPCSDEVWFPSLGIKTALPAFETTVIRIPPTPEGRYPFTCGMNMLHGLLLVGGAPAPEVSPPPPAEETATDPVCGMSVVPSRAAAMSTIGGTPVYFCCASCKERYEAGVRGRA
jgi:Cu+-exporting ATPase